MCVFVLHLYQCIISIQAGGLPSKITYPLTPQQKVAITRNIEKMLNEALQDPKEVCVLKNLSLVNPFNFVT